MGIKDIAKRGGEIYVLPPEEIRKLRVKMEDDFRTQDSINENVAHLKNLIRENGFYKDKPVTIYADGEDYYVDDGRCRTRAVVELLDEGLDLAGLPVVLDDKFLSPEERLFRSFTRNEGMRFKPLETSNLFKRLYSLGWSPADIARRSNVSYANVQAMLELSAAPAELKQMIEDGHVAATTVVNAMREHGSEASTIIQLAVEEAKAEHASAAEEGGAEEGAQAEPSEEPKPSDTEQPTKGRGRPKGAKNKDKKPKVTGAKVKEIAARLSGKEPSPVPAGFTVSPEAIAAISDDELRSFFVEIADFKLVEGQDAWGLEDIIKGWVERAQKLVGVPESV